MIASKTLQLNGIDYTALFHAEGLQQLDNYFLNYLAANNLALNKQLLAYRQDECSLSQSALSEFLIECSKYLEDFLANLFNIQDALAISKIKTTENNPIAIFKKYYVLRRAKKELGKSETLPDFLTLTNWLNDALEKAPLQSQDKELAIALMGVHFLNEPDKYQQEINQLVAWCVRALSTAEGQLLTANWSSFKIPKRIDHQQLVIVEEENATLRAPANLLRHRDGFKLTDPRMTAREVQDEVNYCIYCHDHDGDFCSKGFPVKKGDPAQGFKKNPLDIVLTGCPLEEKISEMNILKQAGCTLASLAMIMIDNPMCPATGHRICNDCMKACIYQKQDPVNIPQIETRVLTDVLHLPWGVEIYDLLTRWNPLRKTQYTMKPYNGLKVMIAGMGPAGFTLAHHLLLEGFAVLGFDGLKIEPFPEQLIRQPIYRFADLTESLDERMMAGFGGVAEYGITVRWDKNFLKLIYLSLARKPYFQVYGGVRFGGTIKVEDAWQLGFDHFALAVGAGLPKAISIPGSMAPGMRQANDFLMALQLGSAAKNSSLTNLQIRLPAVVIGGGLTGVDTATEVQAYYITQVEKILQRFEILSAQQGEETLLKQLDNAEKEILSEYLRHGKEVRKEREEAQAENRLPNFIKLIHAWGGVTIAYRRNMQESPAYINNHEELQKALEEGIFYKACLEPVAVDLNEHGHAETLICHKRTRLENGEWVATTEEVRLPARSILVATGTQPNTAYEFEHRGTFNRLNLQYQHYENENDTLNVAHGVEHCKDPQFGPFTSYQENDKRVSLIGDTHPVFHGNVVKAIASGMRTYPKILALLQNKLNQVGTDEEYQQFAANMRHLFTAKVSKIERKNERVLELEITAPLASKHFQAGQFYRLQNFETYAERRQQTLLQMEPLVLTAAGADKNKGTLNFIVEEKSATSKLCRLIKLHEPVSLMGPTGVRAKIPNEHESILFIGELQSIPFVRCYGEALRQAGNKVLYLASLSSGTHLHSQVELEKACDAIIWHSHDADAVTPGRPQDYAVKNSNDVIDILCRYAEGKLDERPIPISLADIDRVYVLGSANLLRQYQTARHTLLKPYFLKEPQVIGSVYGNMQCMLKGVCAQCLQWQIDPETGKRTKAVFACSWQDQPLEIIDIDHMAARTEQNRLHEKINSWWVDYVTASISEKITWQ